VPLYIHHRRNRRAELADVPAEAGVEIDLRSDGRGGIRLAHDADERGESLGDWLDSFGTSSRFLVLNVKDDGLEERVTHLLAARKIANYAFLDSTIPTRVRWAEAGHGRRFFARLSSYEPLESLPPFHGLHEWLWVDCFAGQPLAARTVARAKEHFRICLVSPELHGAPQRLREFGELFPLADAICTKIPRDWEQTFG
jgi:hypothetical protein